MLAAADDKSDFKFTTDTPYLALTASYGVFLWGFWRKLTHMYTWGVTSEKSNIKFGPRSRAIRPQTISSTSVD